MRNHSNELTSALTHLVGAILAVAGLVVLIILANLHGTAWHVVTFSIFGVSLILLYGASATYHFVPSYHKTKNLFRKLDHSMIFVLIAGTYTPITLISLRGGWGWSMFGIVWGIAVIGILLKMKSVKLIGWQLAVLYLLMGWIALVAIVPLLRSVPLYGIMWLFAGGLFYTIGTIFFGLRDKALHFPWLRAHDIFHIFVMAGSFSHFWMMIKYVL